MKTINLNMKYVFIALLFQFSWGVYAQSDDSDEVAEYEAIIKNGIEEAENYHLPTDNEQYRPRHNQLVEEFGHWDFIVVGAGCGGAVVANRLSEVKHWKVLLIEAGGPESNFSVIPAMHLYLHSSRFNWGYYTTKQKYSCLGMRENRCPMVKGRALGGSSAVNYEFYSRANKGDYNNWAAEGNPGWTYDDILPYFIKSENFKITGGDPGYHGRGGYWSVERISPVSQQFTDFIEGSKIIRYFNNTDYNGKDERGVFQMQINNVREFRDSANQAFLKPIANRKNLQIITNAYVTKVLIGPGRKKVYGVQFSQNGKRYSARARNEVILSAGAINTPQILMLSGIGPRDHLKEMRIPVISNLPVGKTLYDHSAFYAAYIGTNFTEPDPGDLKQQIKNFLNDSGPLAIPSNSQGLGFFQTKYETDPTYPDLEIIINIVGSLDVFLKQDLRLRNETYYAIVDGLQGYESIMNAFTYDLKSQSVGSVTLKSKDPYQHPNIDSNFLAEKYDIEIIYQGILLIQKILETEPLRRINATLIEIDYPQCKKHELGSKDYWYCAFRLMTASSYHQCGTCRMGPNSKTSVVNNKGIVHGFKNLRIVDASIFATLVAGHTAAPTIMIGEKISDLIKLQYGQPIEPITNTIN